jgi:Zn-dependent protease with chaperone function
VNDVAAYFTACLSSWSLLTSACALVVVPTLAWCIVMLATPTLRAMDADARWQAPLSAAAALLPGALFLFIGAMTLGDGWQSDCLRYATGRVLYGAIAALTVYGLLRAIVLAFKRHAEIVRLLASAALPGLREQRMAQHCGLQVRRVFSTVPFVLLAGIRQPFVIISSEALKRLDDAQLDAAIHHEAAHFRHGDQLVAALVTFIGDMLPLPVAPLVGLYRRAREFAADQAASRKADPCALAAAMIALARASAAPSPAGAAAFAEPATVRARLAALLTDTPPSPAPWRRIAMTTLLIATLAAGAAPTIVAFIAGIHCNEVM